MTILPILATALVTGIILGFIFERSQFCTVRILNNAFQLKAYEGLAGLIVLFLLSTILFNSTLLSGVVTKFNLLHLFEMNPAAICGPPFIPLLNLIGSFLFGIGMVFAGMCVAGMLFRIGEGYISAFFTLIGIAIGFGIIPFLGGIKVALPKFFAGITYSPCPTGFMTYDILGMEPALFVIGFSIFWISLLVSIKIMIGRKS